MSDHRTATFADKVVLVNGAGSGIGGGNAADNHARGIATGQRVNDSPRIGVG